MSRRQSALRFSSFEELEQVRARFRSAGGAFRDALPRLLESEVLPSVLEALRKHPRVAWAERVNKGFGRLERGDGSLSPPLAWGYSHALDITGQMRDGRRLEVEVKRPGEHPTDEQRAVIEGICAAKGVAFVARSVADVFAAIPR